MAQKNKFYRNINEIILSDIIDPDSLWELNDDKLVLVDEDQYITLDFEKNKDKFQEEK